MGLLDKFQGPEFAMWLSGIGRGLSNAAQPGGQFDMGNTNALLWQMAQNRKAREKLGGLMENSNLSPEQQNVLGLMAQYDPMAAAKMYGGAVFGGGDQAEWERKARNLQAYGVPEDVAYGIQTGRFKTYTDPVTKETRIIDMAQWGGQPAPQGGPAPAPAPASGGGAPRQETGFGVSGEVPPDKGDYPSAFGAEGVLKNIANVASDFVGMGQLFPDTATAKRQIENLNTQTATLLAEGTETRGGKYLIDRFDKIQAEAAGIQGPEDALKTLGEIKGLLERAYEINQRLSQANVSPTEKSKATATLHRLEPMIQEYDQIITEFQRQYYGPQGGHPRRTQSAPAQSGGGDAPQGVDPQLWQFMTPEERALWQN